MLFHRMWWRLLRFATRPLPAGARHVALSIGSASMLPATVALWLGLEISGFALADFGGLKGGAFKLTDASPSLGTAFYLSAGAISTLSSADITPTGGFVRALGDVETIVGLATYTLALGYVVTAFGVLGRLENLHGRVRRHAGDLRRPESIVSRHFRGDQGRDLTSFLQALADDLENYDQGLRRYPVVYYFHTRRTRRSIPVVFASIGDLVALLRWGLPSTEPLVHDAFLHALHDAYVATLDRLRRSFVGPDPFDVPEPVPVDEFAARFRGDANDEEVEAFRRLEQRGREAAGIADDDDVASLYERYAAWLPFGYRERVVLERVAERLGYDSPEPIAAA
jgi:hypothetical protein